jgi:hypothetical protein
MKESGLRIRVESQLREDFLRACKKDDLTAAQVLRTFMRTYVEQHVRGQQINLFESPIVSATSIYKEVR